MYTWGLNSKGQLGNRTTETVSIPEKITGLDNQVVKVAAGGNLSAIIDSTGDVYVFGDNSKEQIEEFKYNYENEKNSGSGFGSVHGVRAVRLRQQDR